MNPNLDEKLTAKYPKIFAYRSLPGRLSPMGAGFSHDDGWYQILDTMCALIQNYIDHSRKERARAIKYNRALARAIQGDKNSLINFYRFDNSDERSRKWAIKKVEEVLSEPELKEHPIPDACSQVIAQQVKEKFGGLRFYYTGGDEYVYGIVRMAEAISTTTCEVCGATGAAESVGGWVKTVCDKHSRKSVAS